MDESREHSEAFLPAGFVISNRYEIVRYLASGATGSVFVATDRLLEDTTIAIKVLKTSAVTGQEQIKRFLREVKLMNSVNHRNVVRTFDAGSDRDLIYFTMEFIEGMSLAALSDERELDFEFIESLLLQICLGLEAIHNAGIIHRDLKPSNIIVDREMNAKIADFGVARPVKSSLTHTGSIMGSFDYMAPEVWDGAVLTSAVDFYSLGVILYELSVGHLPFYSEQPAQLMRMHLYTPPEPPREVRPEVPAWLEALILRLLQKAPEDRPRDAREIINFTMTVTVPEYETALIEVPSSDDDDDDDDSVLLPPAEPPIQDASDSDSASETPSAKPAVVSGDAVSGIIFQNFPTQDEIDRHEQRMRTSARNRTLTEEEAQEDWDLREIRRLKRLIQLAIVFSGFALSWLAWGFRSDINALFSDLYRKVSSNPAFQSSAPERPTRKFTTVRKFLSDLGGGSSPQQTYNPGSAGGFAPNTSAPRSGSAPMFRPWAMWDGKSGIQPGSAPLSSDGGGDPLLEQRALESKFKPSHTSQRGISLQSIFSWGGKDADASKAASDLSFTDKLPSDGGPTHVSNGPVVPYFSQPERELQSEKPRLALSDDSERSWKSLEHYLDPGELAKKYPDLTPLFAGVDNVSIASLQVLATVEENPEKKALMAKRFELANELYVVKTKLSVLKESPGEMRKRSHDLETQAQHIDEALEQMTASLDIEKSKYDLWNRIVQRYKADDILGAASILALFDTSVAAAKNEYERSWTIYSDRLADGGSAQNVQKLGEKLSQARESLRELTGDRLKEGSYRELDVLMKVAYMFSQLEEEKVKTARGILLRQSPSVSPSERPVAEAELLKRQKTLTDSLADLSRRSTDQEAQFYQVGRVLDVH
ncbi:MAG: serine/threonine-protein kinase [Bdellovibrionota bacterium]